MKRISFNYLNYLLFSLFVLFSIDLTAQKKPHLTYTIKTFAKEGTIVHEEGQPKIDLKVHWFDSKENKIAADSINRQIFRNIRGIVHSDSYATETYEEVLGVFIHNMYRVDFEDAERNFASELWLSTSVYSLTSDLLNIVLDDRGHIGGAANKHHEKISWFFNPKTGREIPLEDLFTDREAFTKVAEEYFRKEYKIPTGQSINKAGIKEFWFEDDVFELPKNIMIKSDKVTLFYNVYEVAPYASGRQIVDIPMRKVKKILKYVN